MLRIIMTAAEWFLIYFFVGFLASALWLIASLWKEERAKTSSYGLEPQPRTHL